MTNSHDEPERLGTAATTAARRISSNANKPASNSSSELSRIGQPNVKPPIPCKPADFARAMAHLTAMKRTAELTKIQLDTWHGALGGFSAEVINVAVLEIALTDVRFPELGDIYKICRRNAIKGGQMDEPHQPEGRKEITPQEIRDIAARLNLKVLQPKKEPR